MEVGIAHGVLDFLPEGLWQDLDLFAALEVARVCVLNFVDHRFHDLCQREFDDF